jgi:hypothetical protein
MVPPRAVFNTLMAFIRYIQERGKRKVKKSIEYTPFSLLLSKRRLLFRHFSPFSDRRSPGLRAL